MYDIAIVGASAAGLSAAIAAGKRGKRVLLIDKNARPGRKIAVTGNGKCNLANRYFDENCYRSADEDRLSAFVDKNSAERVLAFLHALGMETTVTDGYVYPSSMQAGSVIRFLVNGLPADKVDFLPLTQVRELTKHENGFTLRLQKADASKKKKQDEDMLLADMLSGLIKKDTAFLDTAEARAVIVATGGKSYGQLGSTGDGYYLAKKLGHSLIAPQPALVPLVSDNSFVGQLAGVRQRALVRLYIDSMMAEYEAGEVQFTDYGASGIVVFNLSRRAKEWMDGKHEISLVFDFLPQTGERELEERMQESLNSLPDMTLLLFLNAYVPDKLADCILTRTQLAKEARLSELTMHEIRLLIRYLKNFDMRIVGTKEFDQSQVTAGGVRLTEIDAHYRSRLVDGLYFAGEVLDVDGKCGGYNLTFAFLSGMTAGTYA